MRQIVDCACNGEQAPGRTDGTVCRWAKLCKDTYCIVTEARLSGFGGARDKMLPVPAAESERLSGQVAALREEAAADEAEALRDDVALLREEILRLSEENRRLQSAPRVRALRHCMRPCPPWACTH